MRDPDAFGFTDRRTPDAVNRDANRTLALVAGMVLLAGWRRTRPLAGFLYGAALSRTHGNAWRRAGVAFKAATTNAKTEHDAIHARIAKLEQEHGHTREIVTGLWNDAHGPMP